MYFHHHPLLLLECGTG